MRRIMKITVVGTGYVGMSLAVLLSRIHEVVAVDVVPEKVALINERICPIQDELLEKYLSTEKLQLMATVELESACQGADFVIIAVPTNYDPVEKHFDTSAVEKVLRTVQKANPSAVSVIKSTVPVGYTREIGKNLKCENLLFSPEFLREGKALYDNLHPSRIIVGCDLSNKRLRLCAEVFAGLLQEGAEEEKVPMLIMESSEAESVKLFSNTYLAMRVAFFNELDTYAEMKGFDSKRIISGVCMDPRIGDHYNNPSFGYGGYCLPKDTKQLRANFADVPNELIRAVVAANHIRKDFIAEEVLKKTERLRNAVRTTATTQKNAVQQTATVQQNAEMRRITKEGSQKTVVGVYRLAMKTGSDNFRESAILGIIHRLQERGAEIILYEPLVKGDSFDGCRVEKDLETFKKEATLILANRLAQEILDVKERVYSRDLFERD